jgi:hypothetical protein
MLWENKKGSRIFWILDRTQRNSKTVSFWSVIGGEKKSNGYEVSHLRPTDKDLKDVMEK